MTKGFVYSGGHDSCYVLLSDDNGNKSEVLCSPGRSRGERNPESSGEDIQLVFQHSHLEQENGFRD